MSMGYVKGVLDGDGWLVWSAGKNPRIGLAVKAKKFAVVFMDALQKLGLNPHMTERSRYTTFDGYSWHAHMYVVQATCAPTLATTLRRFVPKNVHEQLSYLIGFYHSEGSLVIKKYVDRTCWNWRVYNKDLTKLEFVLHILQNLGVRGAKVRAYNYHVPFIDIQNREDIERLHKLGVTKK